MNTTLRTYLATLIALFLVPLTTSILQAQGNATTTPIVVVDLGQVFEQHPTFKQDMERIKADVKASEADFQARGKDIESRVAKLKTLKPTSDDFIQLEIETARKQAQIQADMTLKRKDFLEQEAKAYHATYQEVKQEIRSFAESNRIGLVLRFSSEEIDPTNRQSVMQGVNQPIVYNQGGLNITNTFSTVFIGSPVAHNEQQRPQRVPAHRPPAPHSRDSLAVFGS